MPAHSQGEDGWISGILIKSNNSTPATEPSRGFTVSGMNLHVSGVIL
ncbi:hypothetical protein [Maridesulfovibrio ferrireducens]|nr:hypothetical protein [Maridesulfovibrio ferrireducens]